MYTLHINYKRFSDVYVYKHLNTAIVRHTKKLTEPDSDGPVAVYPDFFAYPVQASIRLKCADGDGKCDCIWQFFYSIFGGFL